jgi:hypothetical protein
MMVLSPVFGFFKISCFKTFFFSPQLHLSLSSIRSSLIRHSLHRLFLFSARRPRNLKSPPRKSSASRIPARNIRWRTLRPKPLLHLLPNLLLHLHLLPNLLLHRHLLLLLLPLRSLPAMLRLRRRRTRARRTPRSTLSLPRRRRPMAARAPRASPWTLTGG